LLKEDLEAGDPEERRHHKNYWDQLPWFTGDSDEDGKTTIIVEYTALDRSHGVKPPAWRDWVTGRRFMVRAKKWRMPGDLTEANKSPEETMSLWMRPGESVTGKTLNVTVLEIQEPRYVETN
jgi:hypothetical protein